MKRVQDVIKPEMCMIQSCGEAPWVLPAPVGGKKYAANTCTLVTVTQPPCQGPFSDVGEHNAAPVSSTI